MNFSNNNKCNHIIQKSINLFNFSNLKSEQLFRTSDCNSFNYDFSNENSEPNYIKNKDETKTAKNRKISLIDDDNSSSLKTLNIEVNS